MIGLWENHGGLLVSSFRKLRSCDFLLARVQWIAFRSSHWLKHHLSDKHPFSQLPGWWQAPAGLGDDHLEKAGRVRPMGSFSEDQGSKKVWAFTHDIGVIGDDTVLAVEILWQVTDTGWILPELWMQAVHSRGELSHTDVKVFMIQIFLKLSQFSNKKHQKTSKNHLQRHEIHHVSAPWGDSRTTSASLKRNRCIQ